MTNPAVYTVSHGCLAHLSRPAVFTAAAAMFILVYVALWHYHDGSILIVPSTTTTTSEYELSDMINPQDLVEDVIACDLYERQETTTKSTRNSSLPVIYFVTPTYARSVQMAELTRLGQTLSNVASLHWILVEDASDCNPNIAALLRRLKIPFTHLASAMPAPYRKLKLAPRGVSNRRAALQWIRSNIHTGVLYFGDDDNTYDLRLFDEIRDTQNISMFPVGLVGDYAVSAPVVQNGKVVGFYDSWPAGRRFAVDMAGFAVNIKLLHQHPNATIIYKAGFEEDSFLQALLNDSNVIEAKAANCTQVLVWHTRTVQVPLASLQLPKQEVTDSSLPGLFNTLDELNMATFLKKGKPSSVYYLTDV